MKHLASLNKYFIKYKWHLLLGILFVSISNKFAVMGPDVIRSVMDNVAHSMDQYKHGGMPAKEQDALFTAVFYNGLLLLGLALLRGVFMFFMRQTIIVMSRLIEYDQKNEVYNHYQVLHAHFFKSHFTGDLMNRMSEDVSRVRMYTGPSIMYAVNMIVLTIFCIWGMLSVNAALTMYVLIPFVFLAISIYFVNHIIYKKSSKIQAQLSDLTSTAQETYSGIRVIKSFVQERNMIQFFNTSSEEYRKSTINLSLTEAFYFPVMSLFIGLSLLITVLVGGHLAIKGQISVGNIVQFVYYIQLLSFPISSIGFLISMIQRAAASQQRIDEFLKTEPEIKSPENAVTRTINGAVSFQHVSFTYPHTGIRALHDFSLDILPGQKVAIIGKTGSGKSTLGQLLLRMYDATEGAVSVDGVPVTQYNLQDLRRQIGYAPQEAFLFSDTVYNNIRFGKAEATDDEVKEAARLADLDKDINTLTNGYDTVVGERGVMLSGGQKQRMVLARALLKNCPIMILDDCLSAVDTKTEKNILHNLEVLLKDTTALVITHRIFTGWVFDQIIVLDDGQVAEQGTHEELMLLNGRYAKLYQHQTSDNTVEA
jgi:ATP-binding cassette, subfamily B, multidrug efflux pump